MRALRFIITLISFVYLSSTYAQEVFISPDINTRSDFGYEVLTGWPNDRIMLFRDRILKYAVDMYDSSMQTLWSKEIDFNRGFTSIIAVERIDTSFVLIYSYREDGKLFIAGDYYDSKAELLRQTTLFVTSAGLDLGSFKWTVSEDKSKGVIFFGRAAKPFKIIPVDLRNPKMSPAIEINMKEKLWQTLFKGAVVSNEGIAAFVFKSPKSWFAANREALRVFLVYPDGNKEMVSLVPDKLSFMNVVLKPDESHNRLIVAGTYSTKGKQAAGFWMMRMRYDANQRDSVLYLPFSRETVRKLTGKRESKGKGNLQVTDIILRQDGGVILFAEVRKNYRRRPELAHNLDITGPGTTGWMDYYYEDIVAMSIHPNGYKHWEEVMYKHQYSQDDDAVYSSFKIMTNPAFLRLIYNDEISGSHTVSEYLISSEGVVDRRTLINTTGQKLWLRWRDAYQSKYNEIIVPSQGYNVLNIVKIKF